MISPTKPPENRSCSPMQIYLADPGLDGRREEHDAALFNVQTIPNTCDSPVSETASLLEVKMTDELIIEMEVEEVAPKLEPAPESEPGPKSEPLPEPKHAAESEPVPEPTSALEPDTITSEVLEKMIIEESTSVQESDDAAKEVLEKMLESTVQSVDAAPVLQALAVKVSPEKLTRLDKILGGSSSDSTVTEVEKEEQSVVVKEESILTKELVVTEASTMTAVSEKTVSSPITEVSLPTASLASTRESSCNSALECDVTTSNSGTVSSENSNLTDDEEDDFLTTGQKLVIDEGGLESRNTSLVDSTRNTPEASSSKNTKKRPVPDTTSPSPLAKAKKVNSSTRVKKGGSEAPESANKTASKRSAGKKGVRKDGMFEVGEYPISLLAKDAFKVEGSDYHLISICALCMNHKHLEDPEVLPIRCKGKCGLYYHIECLKHPERACELPDHEKDYDPENFICAECAAGEHFCFECSTSDEDSKLVRCPDLTCGRFYHYKCLMGTDPPAIDEPIIGDTVQSAASAKKKTALRPCRQHHCGTCKALGRSGKSKEVDKSLAQCILCPAAYHFNFMCFPAEAQICAENARFMTCPKHRNEKVIEQQSRSSTSKRIGVPNKSHKPRAMSINICLSCKSSGELLVCETCPFTSHVDCAGLDDIPDDDVPWHCPDCSKGKLPMVLDIVWYKAGSHRCWPCQILPSNICPENVRIRAPEGTFVMRYMGTTDYGFSTSSQVLPFDVMDPKWVKNPGSTSQFAGGLAEARARAQELILERNQHLAKWFEGVRPNYTRIKGNKAIPPARYGRKESKNDQEDSVCNCSPNDPKPCGPNSGCLNRDMEYECPKSCLAKDRCMNQRLRNRKYPKLKVFYTADRGWALLAQVDIKKGDLVIEYVGEIITTQERDRRINTMRTTGDVNFYFLDLTEGRVIDAGPAGNLARFANHSCDANCSSEKWTVDGETRIALMAIKDIKKGQEITFDYRWQYEAGVTSRECLCGTDKCNGTIGGKTYKANPVSEKKTPVAKKKPTLKKPYRKSTPKPKTPTSKKPILQEHSDSVTEEDAHTKMDVDVEMNSPSAPISPPIVPSETSEISV